MPERRHDSDPPPWPVQVRDFVLSEPVLVDRDELDEDVCHKCEVA